MKFAKSPSDLEQLITRVHQLIEPIGATVTWNDKILDPDTGQLRQVDGLIQRDGKSIHIECRDHDQVQNVKWIEELIGRRASLRADGIVGVSTSGFTEPSIQKAERFGIVLRTLAEMTDTEVQNWGKAARLTANYVEISQCKLDVLIGTRHRNLLSAKPELKIRGDDFPPIVGILERIVRHDDVEFFPDRNTNVSCNIRVKNLELDGAAVLSMRAHLRGRLRVDQVDVLGFWNYHGMEPEKEPDVVVSRHKLADSELIQHSDSATWTFDLSRLPEVLNCFPYSWGIAFPHPMKFRISPIGIPRIRLEVDVDFEVMFTD